MTSLTNDNKVSILLHALEERYRAISNIRERVQNVALWTLGLFITAGGWLLQSDKIMLNNQRWLFTIAIVASVCVVQFGYLNDLRKGFKSQQRMQAKIEDALGLFTDNIYVPGSIYNKDWKNAGSKNGKGHFFLNNCLLIHIGTAIIICCIWLR